MVYGWMMVVSHPLILEDCVHVLAAVAAGMLAGSLTHHRNSSSITDRISVTYVKYEAAFI
jgi:hypothetical protein